MSALRSTLAALAAAAGLAHAADAPLGWSCTPTARYECSAEKCGKVAPEELRSARFDYEPRARRLSACLWSACYSGRGVVAGSADAGTVAVSGLLKRESPPQTETRQVSLHIDGKSGEFSAVWTQDAKVTATDFGRCERR